MELWLVTIGTDVAGRGPAATAATAALVAAGARLDGTTLPSDPSRAALDAALDGAAGRRIAVSADTADLGRLLRRMMRRDELASTETAVLPLTPSGFLARFGIGTDLEAAARIAIHGTVQTVGVLKDDSGHLLLDRAELRPWSGRRVWTRAYVDDEQLCDGEIGSLVVTRGAAGGLQATVRGSRWRRARTLSGRGLTLACEDAAIETDGAARDQPRRKRIWWAEPEQWRLATRVP